VRAVADVEQYKTSRSELIHRKVSLAIPTACFSWFYSILFQKEALHGEIRSIEDAIARTRARIVQSPERIKKTISIMSTTAMEDKKTVTVHESKTRDLQAKINALLNIEKVRLRQAYFLFS
jgi:kinetochore protein Nuf2